MYSEKSLAGISPFMLGLCTLNLPESFPFLGIQNNHHASYAHESTKELINYLDCDLYHIAATFMSINVL